MFRPLRQVAAPGVKSAVSVCIVFDVKSESEFLGKNSYGAVLFAGNDTVPFSV